MSDALFDAMKPYLLAHEAAVPHLYLDSKGHLTIGIGHLVLRREDLRDNDKLQAALGLLSHPQYGLMVPARTHGPFPKPPMSMRPCVRTLVSAAELAYCGRGAIDMSTEVLTPGVWGGDGADRNSDRLAQLSKDAAAALAVSGTNLGWWNWADKTKVRMSNAGMMALKRHDFFGILDGGGTWGRNGVRAKFHGFDKHPRDAQMAIMDIAFQNGPKGAWESIGDSSASGSWRALSQRYRGRVYTKDDTLKRNKNIRNENRADWFARAADQAEAAEKLKRSTPAVPAPAPPTSPSVRAPTP